MGALYLSFYVLSIWRYAEAGQEFLDMFFYPRIIVTSLFLFVIIKIK